MMANPKPWLHEDAPPEIRRLLHAARCESPSRNTIARTVLVVGSAAAVGTATTGVLGAISKVGAASLGWATKWGAATLLGVGIGTTAAVTIHHYSTNVRPSSAQVAPKASTQSIVRDRRARSTTENAGVVPSAVLPSAEPQSSVAMPQASATSPLPRADRVRTEAPIAPPVVQNDAVSDNKQEPVNAVAPVPIPNPSEDRQLTEEMWYLDQARAALTQSRTQETLKWLDGYQRNCPAQRLLPEALLLRLRAAVRAGDRATALRTARQIESRFPESPHSARAREIIATAHFE